MLTLLICSSDLWEQFFLLLDWDLNYFITIHRSDRYIVLDTVDSSITLNFDDGITFDSSISDINEYLKVVRCTVIE